MSDSQLEKKIRETLRNSSKSSLYGKEACEARRVAFLKQIGIEETSRPVYTFKDYYQYYSWNFTHGILLPAAAGFAMVLFVIGGWVSTAAAAQGALPGDPLYGVKIATEKLQLSLTFSAQKRAELHMAFAGRRLSEMSALNAQQSSTAVSSKTEGRMQVAVDGFKSQVSGATETLQNLKGESEQAVSVARQMEARAQEYKQNTVVEAAEAIEVVEEASDVAVEVMMSNAEQSAADSEAATQVRTTFEERYALLQTEITLMHGRLAVLKDVQASTALDEHTLTVRAITLRLEEAGELMATGAYRTAFSILDEVEAALEVVGGALAELESLTSPGDVKDTQEVSSP